MIVLMNYALPIIFIVGLFCAYKLKNFYPLLAAVVIAFLYTVAQPSYLPKGTVASPRIEATAYVDKPIVDRSLKPMSDADRDKARNDEIERINSSIEDKINK